MYNEFYNVYGEINDMELSADDILLAEDSNAGLDFFSSLCGDKVKCISANEK